MEKPTNIRDRRDGFYAGFCAGYNGRDQRVVTDSRAYLLAYIDGFEKGQTYAAHDDLEATSVFNYILTMAFTFGGGSDENAIAEGMVAARAELAQLREVQAFNNRLDPIEFNPS